MPGFQVDRAKLDSYMLELAVEAGCDLWRPAKVTKCDLNGVDGQAVNAVVDVDERSVTCRWVVDATGRALLLDVSSYYLGLVRASYRDPEHEFLNLPFGGLGGRLAASMMSFYNRRLVALAKRRWAKGCYGRRNAGWRELYDGFVPDARIWKQIWHGLRRWWKCEFINLGLMFVPSTPEPATRSSAATPAEA